MKRILLLIVVLLVILCSCAAAEEDPLFIVQEGWKQGVINKAGEWVVQPIYERIWPFTDAGYAVVEPDEVFESQEVSFYNHFILVDRQGNIAAELPEWRLYNYPAQETQNAVGNAFVLIPMEEEDYCCALYLADTEKMIMLDREFLGCTLTPEAEEYVKQHVKWQLYPSDFILAKWSDRLVLYYEYTDYVKDDSDNQSFDTKYGSGFIILDRQGNKVHEGWFEGEPKGLIWLGRTQNEEQYTIDGSCLLTNSGSKDNSENRDILIDRDGKIIMRNFLTQAYWWDEGLQAVFLGQEGAVLLNGERITEDEYLKRRAAMNPCGIVMFGYKYYDTQGKRVEWPELGDYEAVSDFGTDGLAWIELDRVSCLINKEGRIIAKDVLPELDYKFLQQFTGYRMAAAFHDGWECVFDEENGKYGYINPAGELMYGGFVFDRAEPFRNGAAHVQIMDENYALLDACIDTDGRVIWAENGKKDEVQHQLDGGMLYSTENMSLEEARQALVGEWDDGGGEYIHFPMFFYEDGTGSDAFETKQWTLLENTWGKDAFNGAPFVLVFGETDTSEKTENGFEMWFGDRDSFMVNSNEGTSFISRVSPGYWERRWQKYDSWSQEHMDE